VLNLEAYPEFKSLDEAHHLQYPRNLILHGRYAALQEGEFGPFAGGPSYPLVGPTVLLPVALAFKALGISLYAGRLVIALYALIALVSLYLAVDRIYGPKVAILGCLLFLFNGPTWSNTFAFSRKVIGEIPALAYFSLGYYFWSRSLGQRKLPWLLASGVLFGLSVLAKSQWIVFIAGTLIGVYALDRAATRSLPPRAVIIPIAVGLLFLIGWWEAERVIWRAEGTIGLQAAAGPLPGARVRVMVFTPRLWYQNIKYLAENGFMLLGLPSLAYVLLSTWLQPGAERAKRLFLPVFIVIGLSWYAFASIGWPRYAYAFWALSGIPVAKLWYDLSNGFDVSPGKLKETLARGGTTTPFRNTAVTLLTVVLVGYPAQNTVRRVISATPDISQQQMAQYLDSYVPEDARILSGSWEVEFYSRRGFYHIAKGFTEEIIIERQVKGIERDHFHDIRAANVDYVLDGPHTRDNRMFSDDFLAHDCVLLKSYSQYDLYQVRKDNL